jgi:hypothetical protein
MRKAGVLMRKAGVLMRKAGVLMRKAGVLMRSRLWITPLREKSWEKLSTSFDGKDA